jgi:hypothetical protein
VRKAKLKVIKKPYSLECVTAIEQLNLKNVKSFDLEGDPVQP